MLIAAAAIYGQQHRQHRQHRQHGSLLNKSIVVLDERWETPSSIVETFHLALHLLLLVSTSASHRELRAKPLNNINGARQFPSVLYMYTISRENLFPSLLFSFVQSFLSFFSRNRLCVFLYHTHTHTRPVSRLYSFVASPTTGSRA